MPIVDPRPPFYNGLSISGVGDYWTISGYTCGRCGAWIASGSVHDCITAGGISISTNGHTCLSCGCWVPGNTAHTCGGPFGYRCYGCGHWVFGTGHVCAPPATCNHCYCIDVPPSGERTKPHARCCKCADVRLA